MITLLKWRLLGHISWGSLFWQANMLIVNDWFVQLMFIDSTDWLSGSTAACRLRLQSVTGVPSVRYCWIPYCNCINMGNMEEWTHRNDAVLQGWKITWRHSKTYCHIPLKSKSYCLAHKLKTKNVAFYCYYRRIGDRGRWRQNYRPFS